MRTRTKAVSGVGAALAVAALVVVVLLVNTSGGGGRTLTAYHDAVGRTVDAQAYTFSSEVRTDLGSGTFVVTIDGHVEGQNRTLTVTTDQGTSRMTVENGVATVDRGDGPQQIPVEQVADAPRLGVLAHLDDLHADGAHTVVGTLPASELVQSVGGDAVTGTAQVTVTFAEGGTVTDYVVRALDGRYRAEVQLSDVR